MPGVYISYPFCTQKCTFCNFASGVSSPEAKRGYMLALLEEVRAHRWEWQPETLYFGGGTPSLLPAAELRALMGSVPATHLQEVTLECAPGSFDKGRAEDWVRFGINRVSLGVQSFVSEELRQTGRRHTAETVRDDVATLRRAGITDINIDLIAGLPGQTSSSWEASLSWIERLAPTHVSVYIFEMDEDSRLGQEAMIGGVRYGAALLPSDDATAELYEVATERLRAMGIERYEISNFAQPGYESKHNLKYWTLAPYVGFGLDAHSFDGKVRWSNADDLAQYMAKDHPPSSVSDLEEEHFIVGLRLVHGIEPTQEEWKRFGPPIARWKGEGMLVQQEGRLRLSDRGLLLSNEILQDFLCA